MFDLPRMMHPAVRSLFTTNASSGEELFASARDPALVCSRSAVPMLSLSRIGTPCSGLRGPVVARSASRISAMESASGLSSRIESMFGPLRSTRSTAAKYHSTSSRDFHRPLARPSESSPSVLSWNSRIPESDTGASDGPGVRAPTTSGTAGVCAASPGVTATQQRAAGATDECSTIKRHRSPPERELTALTGQRKLGRRSSPETEVESSGLARACTRQLTER